MQVLRQIISGCQFIDYASAGAYRRSAVQVRVLRQGVQIEAPHEGPLQGAHGRTAVPVRAVRQDIFAVDHPEGPRENALPQVCS